MFGLVPVSNLFIPISTILVESWLYQPIVGIALIFCAALYSLKGTVAKRRHSRESGNLVGGNTVLDSRFRGNDGGRVVLQQFLKIPEKLVTTLLATVVVICILKTVQQNKIWKDPITFYEHTLRHAPKSARFRNNLAMAYADQKRYNEAIHEYRLAIQTNDQYPETHHNLANSLLALGMVQEAELEFRGAIQKEPQFYHSYVSLAALYYSYKRLDLAQTVLEELIKNAPGRWEGYYNLGIVHHIRGDKNRAIALWQKGLAVDPYNKTLRETLDRVGLTINK
ncbi:MAG: tetratricopeptide repeat protein [Elusimicrobia bacterium]|nr:tetratricopeptide repeat protein [Elusimicrobiota bacterium]